MCRWWDGGPSLRRLAPWVWEEVCARAPAFHGGLVRERDAEDVCRRNAARDHVRDAECDDTRLARARARKNKHRTLDGLCRLALLRVERVQIQHGREVWFAAK